MPRQVLVALLTMYLCSNWAHAESSYAVGLSVAADSAEGSSISGLVFYNLSDATSIALDVGVTKADANPIDIRSTNWEIGVSHDFGPVGIEATTGQSGDRDEFSSDEWSVGLFRQMGSWRLSANALRRDIDLALRLPNAPDMQTSSELTADGVRAGVSYTAESGAGFYATASRFDFNRDLTRLNQFRIASLLSPSTLTLSGRLLDHSASIGIDWPVGDRIVSAFVARDRTAIDKVDVDSLTLGWLTPLGNRSDLEIGVGISRDDDETQYIVSVLWLFYGGVE